MKVLQGHYDPNHKPEYTPDDTMRANHKWAKDTGRLCRIVPTTSVSETYRSNYDRIFRRKPMDAAVNALVVSIAIHVAAGELRDFGATANWTGVKEKARAYTHLVIHSAYLEAKAEQITDAVVDAVAAVCADPTDVAAISNALASGDWVDGLKTLRTMAVTKLLPAALPHGELETEVAQLLQAA